MSKLTLARVKKFFQLLLAVLAGFGGGVISEGPEGSVSSALSRMELGN